MIVHLQILRGVAAVLVAVAHAIARPISQGTLSHSYHDAAAHLGSFGVCLFFVISGFIMVHTSHGAFGQAGAPSEFARRRIWRIVPLYVLATALETGWRAITGRAPALDEVVASLLFLPYQIETAGGAAIRRPVVGVGWTLNYEMFFYAIFALCLFLPRRIGLGVVLATLLGLVAAGSLHKPLADTGLPFDMLSFWTDPILLLFAAGVGIGIVMRAWPWLQGVLGQRAYGVAWALAAAILAPVFLWVADPLPLAWRITVWVICAGLVACCLLARPLRRTRGVTLLAGLGDASYSIYLFHVFAILTVEKFLAFVAPGAPAGLAIGFGAAAGIAAGLAVHVVVERPLGTLGRRPARSLGPVAVAARPD